jgi:hypothetical protein
VGEGDWQTRLMDRRSLELAEKAARLVAAHVKGDHDAFGRVFSHFKDPEETAIAFMALSEYALSVVADDKKTTHEFAALGVADMLRQEMGGDPPT